MSSEFLEQYELLLHRIERLKEFIKLNAPSIIIKSELNLINTNSQALLNIID